MNIPTEHLPKMNEQYLGEYWHCEKLLCPLPPSTRLYSHTFAPLIECNRVENTPPQRLSHTSTISELVLYDIMPTLYHLRVMNGKSPSPTPAAESNSSHHILDAKREARATLVKAGWLTDLGDNDSVKNVLRELLKLAATNIGKATGPSTRSRNEGWDRVRASCMYLQDRFEAACFDDITSKVTQAVAERLQ